MLGVFLLALVVRLVYLAAFRGSPFFSQLMVDAQWHDEWAWGWAEGTWSHEGRAFFRAPLYPFWLSVLYRIFGHDLLAVRLVQALLGAGTAAALAGTALRLCGQRAALAAGGIAAAYGALVFFDGELIIPNLLVALLAWALFFLAGSPSVRSAAIVGAFLGVAGIARPNALVLIPAAVFLVWRRNRDGARWRQAVAVAGLGILPALGVSAVNTAVEGTWVFVASQGGVNFYAGNNSRATGRSVQIPELANITSWRQFVDQSTSLAERSEGRVLNSREVSNWWLHRGFSWLSTHPGEAIGLTLRKAYYLVNAYEIPSNRDLYFERPAPLRALLWKLPFLAFPWGVIFPLALSGWVAARRRNDQRLWAWFLGIWVFLYALSILPFFVTSRFRMGLLPPVILLAGFALAEGRVILRGLPAAVGISALILVNTAFLDVRTENRAHELTLWGDALFREGKIAEGLAALESAREVDPDNLALANLLAEGYVRAGRLEDSLELYELVVAGRPDDPDVRFNLGVSYLMLERFDDAGNAFEAAIRLRPKDAAAWVNLGVAYEERRMVDRAEPAYREGIRLAPREELGYLRLAGMVGHSEAVRVLEGGVERKPKSFALRFALASVCWRAELWERALDEVNRALELQPGHTGAQDLKRRLSSDR
jgi:Flp pilus assembly protein TadD